MTERERKTEKEIRLPPKSDLHSPESKALIYLIDSHFIQIGHFWKFRTQIENFPSSAVLLSLQQRPSSSDSHSIFPEVKPPKRPRRYMAKLAVDLGKVSFAVRGDLCVCSRVQYPDSNIRIRKIQLFVENICIRVVFIRIPKYYPILFIRPSVS